jgi:hypothetical protein
MNKRVKVAASQTIAVGDLVCIASGLLTKASSTVHTAIIGIATEAITTGATVTDEAIMVMLLNEKSVIRMVYDPGTKTSLAAADMFLTAYDIDDDQEINLDDTTGGFLLVVAYDNTNDTADVVVKASALWNA